MALSDGRCDCGSDCVVSKEYPHSDPEHYDGISEFECLTCGKREGRWSGKILKPGEPEKRFGGE